MNNTKEILETIKMIEEDKLDIRTITMGISLFDCIDSDMKTACEKIYNKIVKYAKDLVKVGNNIESEFGIPIVNKRIGVTPISMIASATNADNYLPFAITLDKAAKDVGVNFIGGFSALVHKDFHNGDKILINSIPEVLANTIRVCSSVNVGSTQAGINMDAVKKMGEIILKTANLTKDNDSFGCTKLVVFTNAVEDNPFMAGSFHGIGEGDSVINVGISGPGVIKRALEKIPDSPIDEVAETIKKTAFKITRMGQLVGREASKRLNMKFGIVDLSLAPTPTIGDSVAHILEEIGLESVGAHGTVATLAILNDAVKKGGVMACNHIGGLSGAFIPVSEDIGMIDAVKANYLTLDKLETMTCVCSVGLDMIVIPGDTDASTISAIIADEMAIGMINNKTTAVRIIPAINKKVGDNVNFGGLLGYAPIIPISNISAKKFINRGGRVPAPIHALKN